MAEEKNSEAKAAGAKLASGQLAIQKVYVKDISFEAPDTPAVFKDKWEPQVNMELSNDSKKLEENLFDITLGVTITVTANDKTVYLVEVKQAGIFLIDGFPDEALEQILATACPNILFPFAREVVADLVARGGFPQLLLSPVNFDVLWMQQKLQQQQAATDTKH